MPLSDKTNFFRDLFGFPDFPDHFLIRMQEADGFISGTDCKEPPRKGAVFFDEESLYADVKPISSYRGKIKTMVLHHPTQDSTEYSFDKRVIAILKAFPKTDFVIISELNEASPDKNQQRYAHLKSIIEENGKDRNIKLQYANGSSVWMRDPFLTLRSGEMINLVEPIINRRQNVGYADDFMSKENLVLKSGLHFQGGNILVGDDFVMIGKDIIEDTRVHFTCKGRANEFGDKSTQNAFVKRVFNLEDDFEVHVIGNAEPLSNALHRGGTADGRFYGALNTSYQPFFHIDLFITLIGQLDDSNTFYVLLGELVNTSGVSQLHPEEKEMFKVINTRLNEIKKQLEGIKRADGKAKFKIIRSPIAAIFGGNDEERSWRPLSFNNCIVENDGKEVVVYLPTFNNRLSRKISGKLKRGLLVQKTEAFKRKLRRKGIKVIAVNGFLDLMCMGGAIHCVTHDIERI